MPQSTRSRPAAKSRPNNPAKSGGTVRAARAPAHRPSRHRSRLWRYRRLLFLLWLLVFFALAGIADLLSRIALHQPTPQTQSSFIYDTNPRQLPRLDLGEDRVPVRLDQVPTVLQNAVVSTEDRNFYHHGGVDPL